MSATNSQNGGHSSRHHSTASSSRSERSTRSGNPAVESAVTRLLVSIKQLLEALTQWSMLKVDESHVSDVYVRLGNDFNAAVAAFGAFNIDMSELLSVPDDLRGVLETCLAEDATPENLEVYLPTVRQIITNLLQGLRGKQSIYRRIVQDHKHRSDSSGHDRTESRSSRSSKRDTSHRSQLSRSSNPDMDRLDRENGSRKSGASSRRRDAASASTPTIAEGDGPFIGGFSPRIAEQKLVQESEPSETPSSRDRRLPPMSEPPLPQSPPLAAPPPIEIVPPVPPPPAVPASVKRYSLVDKPVTPPSVVVEPSSPDPESQFPQQNGNLTPPPPPPPDPETPSLDPTQAPAIANSLAALKKSEVLERRASKRFSTYNISKMTGAVGRDRSLRGQANRRSLAVSSALTPVELAVLTEVDDEEPSPPPLREVVSRSRSISRAVTPEGRATPPVPPLPTTPSKTPEPSVSPEVSAVLSAKAVGSSRRSSSSKITVFLQLGREVKKASLEPGISLSLLRVLFVDKFSYNPGMENFPAIYIRDPSSGVQYELEDMDEVKEKCLLSLNIEPLDQIKQHIDAQISGLSQDIKELKSAVTSNRHSTHLPNNILGSPVAESTPAPRPSDKQFQNIARRLSRFVSSASRDEPSSPFTLGPSPLGHYPIPAAALQPQMTGGSMASDYSTRVVTDLKTQFDEVQNLRRDLGVMRQLYTEFMKQTKESLTTLRTQTQSVKQLANVNVGGARAYIDSGKQKLDVRTQNVLTEVEKLQDIVENVKDDVIKRQITPKTLQLKTIKKDMDAVAVELQSLTEHITTIKPMWKKTWEEELQNIVEEQQFLTHQEEFLNDLLEDHKAVVEVYGHVEQVINLRGAGSGRRVNGRGFRPPAPEEGHNGLSTVLLGIKTAAVDPEKRLKAIEANQRIRQKELASRSDELQAELTEFVSTKKLKMTGGAEEAERVRQKKNDMTLKAMFTGGSATDVSLLSSPDLSVQSSS